MNWSPTREPPPCDPARTEILPILPSTDWILLPGMCCCVSLTSVAAYGAAREATRSPGRPLLGVFAARADATDPVPLVRVGTIAAVARLERRSAAVWVAELRGLWRGRVRAEGRLDPFRLAAVERLVDEESGDPAQLLATVDAIHRLARRFPRALLVDRLAQVCVEELPGVILPLLPSTTRDDWHEVLEADDLQRRLELTLAHLHAGLPAPAGGQPC